METRVERDEDAKHEPVANKPPVGPDLKILESQVLRGPNYWSYEPAIRLLVDLGSLEHWPSNTLPNFTDVLIKLLPGLYDHGCSLHRPGGFIGAPAHFLVLLGQLQLSFQPVAVFEHQDILRCG